MEVRLPRLPARADAGQLRPGHAAQSADHLQSDAQRLVSPEHAGVDAGAAAAQPPRVPGYLYTTWDYTNTVSGPWSQLNFSYGNSRVSATVIVDAYNQTDGSYRNLQAQQGIDQAFLTLAFPTSSATTAG